MNRREFTRALLLAAASLQGPALFGAPALAASMPEPSGLAVEAAKQALAGNFIDEIGRAHV